jgi:hypothetical protein
MNITEHLDDLLEAKAFGMSYQEYCENFPAVITEAKYNELITDVIYHNGKAIRSIQY